MTLQRIYVAGHTGMVGKAVCRRLGCQSGTQVLTQDRSALDLTHINSVADYLAQTKPDAVVFCAAKVGGIMANDTYPVEFMTDNLLMAIAAIRGAYQAGIKRFLFLGSTCIYPRDAAQPLKESSLLGGPLEKTNEAYALAKICGLKLCDYYRREYGVLYHSAMPTNLYGPGDNYHPQHSHVLPALLRRFHEAKKNGEPEVVIWGTGTPRREFLHVDDLADALVHLLELADPPSLVNVGTGEDCTIRELADIIAEIVDFRGVIRTDSTKPDGTPRKVTDVTRLHATGWRHRIGLKAGIKQTYQDFLAETILGVRER